MRKDRVYKQSICLNYNTFDITSVYCGCYAGKGQTASCKHIHVGAFCYAFVEFCTSVKLPNFPTCTDKPQAWNKPGPMKVEVILVEDFTERKARVEDFTERKALTLRKQEKIQHMVE